MWVAACLMAFSVLIGCTDGGDKSGGGNSRKSTEAQPDYEPLALIVHHTRGSHNLKPAAVRQLLAQGVDTWSDLGLSGGSVNVVAAGINDADNGDRSEERRVGKECRGGGAPAQDREEEQD